MTMFRRLPHLVCAVAAGLLLAHAPVAAQGGGIVGTVQAEDGQPLAGAQVLIAGTTLGVVTNSEGRFVLPNVPAGTHTVVVQFIGYSQGRESNVQVRRGETVQLEFVLRTQALSLEGVVVTGVADPIEGVKVPFSVGRVRQEDISSVPTTQSALAALQGKVAGVNIVRGSGQPGQGVSILLRTPTSIQTSNTPMFVVDGVIMGSQFGNTTSDLESLDIESVEVVKGAAAASLYGSRAASGVIQITTARGSQLAEGTTQIDVRTEMGISQGPQDYPLSNHHHYQTNAQGEWLDGDGNVTTDINDRVVDGIGFIDNEYGVPLYNNVERFFQPDLFTTQSVSLAQNTRSTNFRLSMNNYRERGSLENNDGYWRRNVRLNLDHRIGDDVNVSGTIYHNRSKQDDLSGSPFWDLLMYPPEVDLSRKDSAGNYLQQPDENIFMENPIWRQSSRENFDERARTMGNVTARYSPFNWLSFTGQASYDRADIQNQIYVPKGTPLSLTADNPSDGRFDRSETTAQTINASMSANLLKSFGDLTTRLSLTSLMEREEYLNVSADGRDLGVMDVKDIGVARVVYGNSNMRDIRANGYYAQAALDYDGRYIADVLLRRDGSSLFGPDSRWNTYYRGAFAYRMSEESWWPIEALNEFKLRYARGTAGNRPGFDYRFETWSYSGVSNSISKGTLGNRALKPELKTEQEFGLDLIALDRYSLQLTYVTQTTEDQLIQLVLPAVMGYPSQWDNAGTQKGTTLEATLEALFVNRPNLSWTSTFVADRSETEITEFGRACFISGLRNICAGASLADMWGESMMSSPNQLPDYHDGSQGAFAVNDEGWLVAVGEGGSYKDGRWGETVTVDGLDYSWGMPILVRDSIGNPELEKIGSSLPDLQFGWLNNFRWNNVTLHSHVHAQFGGEVYNATKQRLYQHTRHADLDQAGKAEELKKPEEYYYRLYNRFNVTNVFLEEGSFVKLRELSLKYTVRPELLQKVRMGWLGAERISLGVIGRNLLTLTDYSGFDPEVGSVLNRRDNFAWPHTRTLTGVVEFTF